MARLDTRIALARDLASVNQQIACISIDGPAAEFATESELVQFRAGLERARREVTRAELALQDLTFGVRMTA